ncbi:MAG: DUF488 family protein [Caulobacterales bacterium]|jgi:uncharacterized protein (DUF488 family)
MTGIVFTAGYQGVSLPTLIGALQRAKVTEVADVRQLPLSRRAGFSKRMLEASLAAEGIGYTHFKELGTPKEGRSANNEGRIADFWAIVERSLARPEAVLQWQALRTQASTALSCLVCFCENEERCHRLRLRGLFEAEGVEVRALPLDD